MLILKVTVSLSLLVQMRRLQQLYLTIDVSLYFQFNYLSSDVTDSNIKSTTKTFKYRIYRGSYSLQSFKDEVSAMVKDELTGNPSSQWH